MSKIIEEAAKRFADKECEIGQVDWDALYKGYYHGMKDLFSQPLASRMTEEEKERVRKMYKAEKEHVQYQMRQANASMNQMCRSWHNQLKEGSYAKLRLLESIFGKEFFKEE